jgi:hypothetical protein
VSGLFMTFCFAILDVGEVLRCGMLMFTWDRFSRDKPRFQDTLDAIKFLCKDLWLIVFRKQIDNLKTNHRVGSPTSNTYIFQAPNSLFRVSTS